MTNNKSDKPLAIKTSVFCTLAIMGWHLAFAFALKSFFSVLIDGIAIGLFLYQSYRAYKVADDGVKDNSSRAYLIAYALFILVWVGGWAAYQNELVK